VATVNFATSNGTAIAGTEYTATSGTLSFASGDTSKTFNVSIIPTHVFAPDKTVNLTLSNATGAALAAPSTAVLTIRNTTPPPPPCTFAINSPGINVGAGGGPGSVSVTSGAGCNWTAVSNVSWITITAGASGAGNGTVNFSVAPNSGPARSGTLTVAGQTFTVTQDVGCAFSISPTSQSFNSSGGTGTVNVTATGGCAWSAASNAAWISVPSGSGGSSSGAVGYSVAANTGPARGGTVTIAGLTFTVMQSAANTPVGSNVLAPADGVTGISALFANVLAAGRTVAAPGDPCHPVGQTGDPCRIPGPGFTVFSNFVFDISTTATVAGPITLSFDLARLAPIPPPITPQVFSTLRVLHGESRQPGGPPIFVDRTAGSPPPITPQPPPIMPIFAQVSSLSPFVIAQMNDKIVFSSTRDGNFEIYSMNSDGTGAARLTNNPAMDAFPAWSPDNTKIAFTSNRDGFFNFEIYVMNADGSSPTRLTTNGKVDGMPAWSPDGKKIAFTSKRDGNFEIYVMNTDGTGLVRLTNNPAIDAKPSWSPDGTKIAFTSNRDGHFQIYSMNADGTGVARLTNNLSADLSPAWSPDGTKIAFASNRDGNFEVYVMNADGTSSVRLTNNPAVDGEPVWSPDGAKIVFSSTRDGNFEIYIMNADGSGQIRLTTNLAADTSPTW